MNIQPDFKVKMSHGLPFLDGTDYIGIFIEDNSLKAYLIKGDNKIRYQIKTVINQVSLGTWEIV